MDKPAILKATVPATVPAKTGLRVYELLASVNDASRSSRAGLILLIALTFYYGLALSLVTDRDLLAGNPINLPLLGVPVGLRRFLLLAPLVYLFIHLGVLLEQAGFSKKAQALVNMLEGQEIVEMAVTRKPTVHPLRYEVSTFYLAQLIAGPPENLLIRFFQQLMVWSTLVFLPLSVLLGFQIAFLPLHDLAAIWALRAYLTADIVLLVLLGVFLTSGEREFWPALGFVVARTALLCGITALTFIIFLFLAFGAATVPGEWLDRKLSSTRFAIVVPGGPGQAMRRVFAPTADLFEGMVDEAGRVHSPFHRNLIVIGDDLSPRETAPQRPPLSLRYRDLRYARFDRSNLSQADLTCANLTGAVMTGAKLDGIKSGCPYE
ncbi:MAG TPA: pentapeptide repeat-containing protein [Hyphomicrobiales bacterium]|nr:pentapeptide repeat-containing protein [Hyphomicrobiales bacterium]